MTAHEIAKELEINPQTVLRVIRAMKNESAKFFEDVEHVGITKPVYNFNATQTEAIKLRIFAYARKFKDLLPKPSTAGQRWGWFEDWKKKLEEEKTVRWRSIAAVMGLIFLTGDSEFLQRPMLIGRVGDHIALLVDDIMGDRTESDRFSEWLKESGFSAVNTVL